jgi:uncharacterized protein
MIELVAQGDAVLIPVKVVPGASRTRLMGELDGRLKVAVAAPPEKGKANAELTAHLAKLLGVRKREVTVISGTTSPAKVVSVAGVSLEDVQRLVQ